MPTFTKEDVSFDKNNIWHPYTSLTHPLPTYAVTSAQGVRITLDSGKELIDGMSSWWAAIHGYNVPALNQALQNQLHDMAHVMFGGLTHQPAIQLCKKLVEITPRGLEKVFLADSGSVAVEVALKMAIQYQQALGFQNKTKFMTFRNGYYGDTSGAMALCDPQNGMHHIFSHYLTQHHFYKKPQKRFEEKCQAADYQQLDAFFRKNSPTSAGFILEPIVQGAGGMWFYSPDYVTKIRSLCDQYQILLIADEIATGFGRTGRLFACEYAAICPDIMCVGKALTGGYMTLSATLCKQKIADTIGKSEAGVFMHGPTFMGNPLSCAVARSSIQLLLQSPWQQKVKNLEQSLKVALSEARISKKVADVRVLGGIGVIEMKENIKVEEAQRFFVNKGVWIRPFKNLLYLMPPYCIEKEDLRQLTDAMVAYCFTD